MLAYLACYCNLDSTKGWIRKLENIERGGSPLVHTRPVQALREGQWRGLGVWLRESRWELI